MHVLCVVLTSSNAKRAKSRLLQWRQWRMRLGERTGGLHEHRGHLTIERQALDRTHDDFFVWRERSIDGVGMFVSDVLFRSVARESFVCCGNCVFRGRS